MKNVKTHIYEDTKFANTVQHNTITHHNNRKRKRDVLKLKLVKTKSVFCTI